MGSSANLLLEEAEDEVGNLLADTIERGVRTALATVAARPPHLVDVPAADGFEEVSCYFLFSSDNLGF